MAQHAAIAPRSTGRISKIAKRVGIAAIILAVLWIGLAVGAAVANVRLAKVEAPLPAQVSQPACQPVAQDAPVMGYWTELKPAAEGGPERLYGDLRLAPADAVDVVPA